MQGALVQALMISVWVVGVPLKQVEVGVPAVDTLSGSQKPWLHVPALQSAATEQALQPAGVPLAPGILLK